MKHRDDDCDLSPTRAEATEQQSPSVLLEAKKTLGKVSADHNLLQAFVNVLANDVRAECSSIRESLSNAAVKHTETCSGISDLQKDLNRMAEDLKGGLKEYLNRDIDALSKVVSKALEENAHVLRCIHCPNQLHWYLNDWGEFKSKATANGITTTGSSATYMHGYNVVYVVQIEKDDTQLKVGGFLRLVKGGQDSVLLWPFCKTYNLSVIHPQVPSKTLSHTVHASEYPGQRTFRRPKDIPAPGYGTSMLSTAAALESGGYVTDDSLHLCLEVLP